MEFSTLTFLFFFFPIFLFSYFIIKNRKYRNIVLLIFSLLFYAWGEPVYILLMILSIIMNYYFAKLIDKSKSRKLILIISIICNIGLLVVFKYTDFIISIFNFVFRLDIKSTNIALPIGISFYTFQILSYVIDVYRKKVKVQNNIINLGCYISAFPQLIAGPIVTYDVVEKELSNRVEDMDNFYIGTKRFIIGLAKKILLANSVGYICDSIFGLSTTLWTFPLIWLAVISYTLQIYFDFSAYSDMAIGMGRMLGFHYLENFNYPYISKSITEFWRRWHISLSTWFRDYVYIPLGGNRVSKKRMCMNIMIVWALTGLWHGASINYLLWGLYYGIILLLEKLLLKKYIDKMPNIFKHMYTIIIFVFGWTIFRLENLSDLLCAFKSLLGFNGFGNLNMLISLGLFKVKYIFYFILAIIFSMKIDIKSNEKVYNVLLIILFIYVISIMVTGSYNPFIYFRF
ncbi:MAG: MBOAT family protein [Bacillales bacterium]|nr:MBOAT family protein [Bacillales bacterium]